MGVQISNNTYDENKQLDSFSYGVFTGFELAPSRLLSGNFIIGYTILNFDRAPVQQPMGSDLSNGGKQQKRLTMRGNLEWTPTSRFYLRILPFRSIRQSATSGSPSTFVQTGVSINARHRLSDRLGVNGNVYYQNDDFEEGRRDNRIRTSIGLDYRTVEWLGFRLDYLFGKRFSNDNRFEFYSNTILVSIQVFL